MEVYGIVSCKEIVLVGVFIDEGVGCKGCLMGLDVYWIVGLVDVLLVLGYIV